MFDVEAGDAVELRVIEPELFATSPVKSKAWRIDGDELHAHVVYSTPARLCVDVDVATLDKLGFETGESLEIEINGQRRVVHDKRTMSMPEWDERLEELTKAAPPENEERAEALEDEIYDADGRLARSVDGWQEKLREIHRLAYHPDDLACPPLILDFMENPDVPGWYLMTVRSGLWKFPNDPDEIHLAAETNAPVVIRKT